MHSGRAYLGSLSTAVPILLSAPVPARMSARALAAILAAISLGASLSATAAADARPPASAGSDYSQTSAARRGVDIATPPAARRGEEPATTPDADSLVLPRPSPGFGPATGNGWAPSTNPMATAGATPPASAPASKPPANDSPSEDIRDIRGPKYIFPAWLILAIAAAIALLALAAYALWRRQRRRRAQRPLLPFEAALQRLEQIRPLMQPSSVREFSIAITDIVRRYIEERFQVTAAHRTTEEFLRDLLEPAQGSLAVHRSLLAEFLHQCDLAKFAGMALTRDNMESLYHSARTFVLQTAEPDPIPAAAREETRAALPAT